MEFGPLLAREAGGSVLQGEIPGVGMGIRNPQNSEEQPRKSGSLVELGKGCVWQESTARGTGRLSLPGVCTPPTHPPVLSPRLSPGGGGGEGRQELR